MKKLSKRVRSQGGKGSRSKLIRQSEKKPSVRLYFSLIKQIFRFVPVNKRYVLYLAVRSSKIREFAPQMIRDTIYDATGNRPDSEVEEEYVMMLFEDLRWVLTSQEFERVHLEIDDEGKLVHKSEYVHCKMNSDAFYRFMDEEVRSCSFARKFLNRDAYSFAVLASRVYFAEFGYDKDADWLSVHILFYFAYARKCLGKEVVEKFLRRHLHQLIARGFLKNYSVDSCSRRSKFLVDRILRSRQTDDIGDIRTPVKVAISFYEKFKLEYGHRAMLRGILYSTRNGFYDGWLNSLTPSTSKGLELLSEARDYVPKDPIWRLVSENHKNLKKAEMEKADKEIREFQDQLGMNYLSEPMLKKVVGTVENFQSIAVEPEVDRNVEP